MLRLQVGDEVIEVRIDAGGLHFAQPGASVEGHLAWDVAVALSLVPERAHSPSPAA